MKSRERLRAVFIVRQEILEKIIHNQKTIDNGKFY
ncbi:Uncharacterised protein [Rikenella microfusus]|uniref:Uncharacterized protein n=1 Tax=Rikenella microfusus TaxID=28139 RepID=A0A379MVT0_9BACT|nr:Uncharacterised protein [Rikenella microfusus]